jgi:hypothetical protein
MERARELRENAARCLRLSKTINAPADVAWLETFAAESTRAAEWMEAKEAAGVVDQYAARWSVEGSPGVARAEADALPNRGARLEPDTLPDRRRPGRRDDVSPVLIPLLRGDSITSLSGNPAADEPVDLGASRGVIIWALISVAVWASLVSWMIFGGRGR